MPQLDPPDTATERAALVTWWLAGGLMLSTADAGLLLGLTHDSAYRLLCRLSRVLPIYQDGNGYWMVLRSNGDGR
ncbi:MAG: hypothetical protein MUC51_17480 [Anaerolineae bacterium]|jgi:hypothetical protein|nr:hypothetical protein [Anaerolineae bacterium]